MMILVTGGSASGKSAFAERIFCERSESGGRTYLATMQAYGAEAAERIERHRRLRAGKGFITVECPIDILSAATQCEAHVLLEDLGNLLANEMFQDNVEASENAVSRIREALLYYREKCSLFVVVTNEVFSDGCDYDSETMRYIRKLGQLNVFAAGCADEVYEIICGIPVRRKQVCAPYS